MIIKFYGETLNDGKNFLKDYSRLEDIMFFTSLDNQFDFVKRRDNPRKDGRTDQNQQKFSDVIAHLTSKDVFSRVARQSLDELIGETASSAIIYHL